jgi:hypothetical protein
MENRVGWVECSETQQCRAFDRYLVVMLGFAELNPTDAALISR